MSRGLVLSRPDRDLSCDVVARLAEIVEPDRGPIHEVQPGQRIVHRVVDARALVGICRLGKRRSGLPLSRPAGAALLWQVRRRPVPSRHQMLRRAERIPQALARALYALHESKAAVTGNQPPPSPLLPEVQPNEQRNHRQRNKHGWPNKRHRQFLTEIP